MLRVISGLPCGWVWGAQGFHSLGVGQVGGRGPGLDSDQAQLQWHVETRSLELLSGPQAVSSLARSWGPRDQTPTWDCELLQV